MIVSSSGLFTENIYKSWRPSRSNAHYLLVTRIMMVVVVASGSVALLGDTLHNAADALTAIPLWLAFRLGRRAPTTRYT